MTRRPLPARDARARAPGQVRIIGGRWRGSKLPVTGVEGLRPTADRVRETLFNWLQAEVAGARAIDLFAGSGALGFEAASRGAAQVDLVEASPRAAAALRDSVARLSATGPARDGASDGGVIVVHHADALAFLAAAARAGHTWDLAFVDPPFAGGLWDAALAALAPCLAPRAHVYVEAAVDATLTPRPGWALHRELSTREATARLFRVAAP
jgi:16S rRNA (guanine966-N2)-methyltransferase